MEILYEGKFILCLIEYLYRKSKRILFLKYENEVVRRRHCRTGLRPFNIESLRNFKPVLFSREKFNKTLRSESLHVEYTHIK